MLFRSTSTPISPVDYIHINQTEDSRQHTHAQKEHTYTARVHTYGGITYEDIIYGGTTHGEMPHTEIHKHIEGPPYIQEGIILHRAEKGGRGVIRTYI